MFLSILAFAQSTAIKGSILDEVGEPVIGASVLVKGTKIGTTSDLDGQFVVKTSAGKTLVITFIGYERQEVKAQNGMKITLKSTSQNLEGVVVTGMSRMDKRFSPVQLISLVQMKQC